MRALADNKTILIKKADKGSCVVVWDHNDYIKEAEKQLNDTRIFSKILKLIEKLVTSNLNILCTNIKRLLTLVNSVFYLRYINAWQMFLEGS